MPSCCRRSRRKDIWHIGTRRLIYALSVKACTTGVNEATEDSKEKVKIVRKERT